MVETVPKNGFWHIILTMHDLVNKGNLNKKDLTYHYNHFEYKKRKVDLSHSFQDYMVVSIQGVFDLDFKELVQGFSKIVEYEPFCKYHLEINSGLLLPTYEWNKFNSKSCYDNLNKNPNVKNLEKLL